MTVANNYTPVVVAANGSTTVFSGSWNAISASAIVVQLLNTTTGVSTLVTQGSASNQYQVTALTSASFSITFNTAPAAGSNVVISRSTTPQQTVPYTTSRGFQGSVEELSFDQLTTMIQELLYTTMGIVQVPIGDTPADMVLPIVSLRAGHVLAFDASGNVIVSDQTLAEIENGSAGAAASAAAAAASAAAAANYAAELNGTSTSTAGIAIGPTFFITQSGKQFASGQLIIISSIASPTNYMYGQITSYNSITGNIIIQITNISGSGTFTNWNLSISGLIGPQGASGSGSVSSVGMTGDGVIFNATVSGSPVTSTGSLQPALLTQTANKVLAGPASGSAATPTFRSLVISDLPASGVTGGTYTNPSSVTVNSEGQVTAIASGSVAIPTPLGVGSIIMAKYNSAGTINAGSSVSSATITAQFYQTTTNSMQPTGDTLTGTWTNLQKIASTEVGLFQRTA